MARLAERTGRRYRLVDYNGHPEAERVIVLMGSGGETAQETVACATPRRAGRRGCRCGCTGRSRRRRSSPRCPRPCARVAVLDRTKEPGSIGEPLFLDVVAALTEAHADGERERDAAGRSAAATACPRRSSRRAWSPACSTSWRASGRGAASRSASTTTSPGRACLRRRRSTSSRARRCARSSSASARTARSARTRTRSRSSGRGGPARAGLLRLRLEEVRLADGLAPALRAAADPCAVPRAAGELRRLPPVRPARAGRRARPGRADGATLLLNCPHPPDEVWDALSRPVQEQILAKRHRRCTRSTPAGSPARPASPGGPTSSCRPASSPSPASCRASEAIERIKAAVAKTYGRRGAEVVERNQAAVDRALEGLHRVEVPERVDGHAASRRRSCRRTRPSSSAPSPRR